MKNLPITNSSETAGQLYSLLEKIVDGLDKLYLCLRSQQNALMSWDLSAFNLSIREQGKLARKNLAWEHERQELVAEVVGPENQTADQTPVKLPQLAEMFGGKWSARFAKISGKIRAAAGKADNMKKQNEMLINKSKTLVGDQLKLLVDLARLNRNLYGQKGQKSPKKNLRQVMDQRA